MKVLDENVAYEIFESTNARGLDLSIADLLKNYIFRNIEQDNDTFLQAESFWNEMAANIDSTGDELKNLYIIGYQNINFFSMFL